MHGIKGRLVARIGVDRGHEALVDADGVIKNLRNRRQAVRGARGVGDDDMVLAQLVMVHAIDNCEIGIFARR